MLDGTEDRENHIACSQPGDEISDPAEDCTESEELVSSSLSPLEAYYALPQCVHLKVVDEASKTGAGNLCEGDICCDWSSFLILFSKQSDVSWLTWLRKAGVEGDDVETSFILIREILCSLEEATAVKRPSFAAMRQSEISE